MAKSSITTLKILLAKNARREEKFKLTYYPLA